MIRPRASTRRLRALVTRGPGRGRFAAAVAGIVLMLALAGAGMPAARGFAVSHFVTRPDLRPPAVDVYRHGAMPGYVFLSPAPDPGGGAPRGAQAGALLVDNTGRPVWFGPTGPAVAGDTVATDFRAQTYRGRRVLTWFQGEEIVPPGMGKGRYVIMDDSYRRLATVRAGHGLRGDLHEFLITPRDTALITIYRTVRRPAGPVTEGVVQELDIATGRVLFEWHSLAHVPVSASYVSRADNPGLPFDYFHLNSISLTNDGNLLVSSRHTSTVYKVDRDTGAVIWRLGGKHSDFRMGAGTDFGFQHDARQNPDGTISLFDNGTPGEVSSSRAVVLGLDTSRMTAALLRERPSPSGSVSFSQGSSQQLPGGGMLVGWGSEPFATEFDRHGRIVFNAVFGPNMDSYRAYRMPWVGRPYYPPTTAALPRRDGGMLVFASWNGATEVAAWRVLAGPRPDRLRPVRTVARSGFETAAELDDRVPYVAVQALDARGELLGTSEPARIRTGPPVPPATLYPATPLRCPLYGSPATTPSC